MNRLQPHSALRRLTIAVLVLAAVDQFVPAQLARLEHDRYESNRLFRFEDSDLFSLGPLVAYLREHPRGEKARVAFFGDSVIWGYSVRGSETVPAQFQRLRPDVRVFNAGINNFTTGGSYLMAKAMIEAIDTMYVLVIGSAADPSLAKLIPVRDEDVTRFDIERPDRVEQALHRGLGFWNAYTNSYRVQSALFGTSTRVYWYLHKGNLASRVLGRPIDQDSVPSLVPDPDHAIRHLTWDKRLAAPRPSPARRELLANRYSLLWQFAMLATEHGKQVVFIELGQHSPEISDEDRGDLNATFEPHATFIRVGVPAALTTDSLHLTPVGSAAVAELLAREVPPLPEVLNR